MAKPKAKTSYRRSGTGEYTSVDYANKLLDTSTKETDKIVTKKKTKSTKKENKFLNLIN